MWPDYGESLQVFHIQVFKARELKLCMVALNICIFVSYLYSFNKLSNYQIISNSSISVSAAAALSLLFLRMLILASRETMIWMLGDWHSFPSYRSKSQLRSPTGKHTLTKLQEYLQITWSVLRNTLVLLPLYYFLKSCILK